MDFIRHQIKENDDYFSHIPAEIIYEIFKFIYFYQPILSLVCKRFHEFFMEKYSSNRGFAAKLNNDFVNRPDVRDLLKRFLNNEKNSKSERDLIKFLKLYGYYDEILPYLYGIDHIIFAADTTRSKKKLAFLSGEERREIREKINIFNRYNYKNLPLVQQVFEGKFINKRLLLFSKYYADFYDHSYRIFLDIQIIIISLKLNNLILLANLKEDYFTNSYLESNNIFNLDKKYINYIIETGNIYILRDWGKFFDNVGTTYYMSPNLNHYFYLRKNGIIHEKKDIEFINKFFIDRESKFSLETNSKLIKEYMPEEFNKRFTVFD